MAGTGGSPAREKGDLPKEEWRIINTRRECILGNESVAIPFDVHDEEPCPSTSAQTCSTPALTEPLPVGLLDAQPATPTVSPPDVPNDHTSRTYARHAHIPDIPDWARELKERNTAIQERLALAMERMLENQNIMLSLQQDTSAALNRLLDNQQRMLRLLEQGLPTFVDES